MQDQADEIKNPLRYRLSFLRNGGQKYVKSHREFFCLGVGCPFLLAVLGRTAIHSSYRSSSAKLDTKPRRDSRITSVFVLLLIIARL